MPRMSLAGYLAIALLVAAVVAWSQWSRNQALSADVKRLEKVERDLNATISAQVKLNQELAEQDAEHYNSLQESRRENALLRAAERRGDARLHVHANCPAVPDADSAGSVVDGASPELTPDARAAYFDLRDGIDTVTKQLDACQDYARAVSGAHAELDDLLQGRAP